MRQRASQARCERANARITYFMRSRVSARGIAPFAPTRGKLCVGSRTAQETIARRSVRFFSPCAPHMARQPTHRLPQMGVDDHARLAAVRECEEGEA